MVERLYQSSWAVRYLPYPILFGAFLLFDDTARWWSILGLTALYTLGTWYLDIQRHAMVATGHVTDPALWGRRFAIGSAITGMTWGLLGVLYFPAGDVQKQGVMAVAWAGIAFSSMNTRAAHLPSFYAFLFTMSAPLYLRAFVSGELSAISMALLGIVLGTAFSLAAHATNRRERLSCALRLRNAELIGDVDRARAAAESGRLDLEAALRATVNDFAAAQRIAECGGWARDCESDQISCSEECSRLLGVTLPGPASLAVLLGQIHPDDRAALRAHHQRLCEGAARDRVVLRRADPKAAGQWLESIGEAERDAAGRVLRICGILRPLPLQSTL